MYTCTTCTSQRVLYHAVGHVARLRVDYFIYPLTLMLKSIKYSVERYNDGFHVIFLLQVSSVLRPDKNAGKLYAPVMSVLPIVGFI